MNPQNAKAPAVDAAGALSKSQLPTQFSAKSTATEAQRDRILQALRQRPQTSYDLRCMGCYQAPARVKELRDRFGYGITTDRITLYDRDGYGHPRAALYTLVSEPEAK
jgi:hypothetical protein